MVIVLGLTVAVAAMAAAFAQLAQHDHVVGAWGLLPQLPVVWSPGKDPKHLEALRALVRIHDQRGEHDKSADALARLVDSGFLVLDGSGLRATEAGRQRLNAVLGNLLR